MDKTIENRIKFGDGLTQRMVMLHEKVDRNEANVNDKIVEIEEGGIRRCKVVSKQVGSSCS